MFLSPGGWRRQEVFPSPGGWRRQECSWSRLWRSERQEVSLLRAGCRPQESPGLAPAPGAAPVLGERGLPSARGQSSPRSESEDDLSSAMSRRAFSMGARVPLGVMPMGWMTCSLQHTLAADSAGTDMRQQKLGAGGNRPRQLRTTQATTKGPF